ncbi:MAG: dihydrodipicolinate synthase family protein [Verrucomicrobiota bacterium]
MNNQTLSSPLCGIIPPMVTPLLERDSLDIEGMEHLIEHILGGGVHGLFLLGTTGEAPGLGYRLRHELIDRACQQVGDRVPVLVGITDTSFVESVNMAKQAAEAGASAVVIAPPYYFPAGQAELLEYLQHLVPELPLPVFLYNMPSHTKLVFEPDTVRQTAEIPGVIGLKDSSANMIYFHRLQELFSDRPDFSLLVGPEELLGETLLLGGHGGVSGGANIHPTLYVDLYHAAVKKDLERVAVLHKKIMQISSGIYSIGRYGSSFLKGVKCSLSCMGICSDFMAEPFHRFNEPERAQIRQHLTDLGLLPWSNDPATVP